MKYPQIYIEEFYATSGGSKCANCKAPALKSMCEKHLKRAAERFRSWVLRRYRKGKCYQCNRHRCYAEQRCEIHKEINRVKCITWSHAKRDFIYAQIKRRKDAGICAASDNHGKVYKDHILCKDCFLRQKSNKQRYGARQ